MAMSTISGSRIASSKKMHHWHSVVEEWILAHERFSRLTGDAAYWYTERANIGVVAGAAWRCGMVALEEFQVIKNNAGYSKKKDQKDWSGRCDLWMVNDRGDEIIESKLKCLCLRTSKAKQFAAKALEDAVKDACASRWSEKTTAIGLVFLPIYTNARLALNNGDLDELIEKIVKEISEIDTSLIAWCFPEQNRSLLCGNDKNYWPGIIMIGRIA